MTWSGTHSPFHLGPKVWTRFLLGRFSCELHGLNAQLPLPIETGEVFKFGVTPRPTPLRYAPKIFERHYDLGTNPDGCYACEPDEKFKFNLYKRVVERVPECKHWLLTDWAPYFEQECPHIDVSAEIFTRLSKEMGFCLVDRRAFQAWEATDPEGFKQAQTISSTALMDCQVPEIIAFILSMLHLAVWQNVGGENKCNVIWDLQAILVQASRSFSKSPAFDSDRDSWEIACQVVLHIHSASQRLERWGMRSQSKNEWRLTDIPQNLVLVKRCEITENAILTLHAGGDMWCDGTIFELFFPGAKFPTSVELADAAKTLLQSTIDMQLHLRQRAEENLKKVEPVKRATSKK